jgi:hypothetical protein
LHSIELIHSIFQLLYPSQGKFAKCIQNFALGILNKTEDNQ